MSHTTKRLTTVEFIRRAKAVHGDTYDYSQTIYTSMFTKVRIGCPVHGVFDQDAHTHLNGSGCRPCGRLRTGLKERSTTELFVKAARQVHGDIYDYSQVDYTTRHNAVTITCRTHGDFRQAPRRHLAGRGCRKCRDEKRKLGAHTFIARARSVWGNAFDYSEVMYVNNRTPVRIRCITHDTWFIQRPGNHVGNRSNGCPVCTKALRSKLCRYSKAEFVSLARKAHGDRYDYDGTQYDGCSRKVTVRCRIHGLFSVWPGDHTGRAKAGCQKCVGRIYYTTKDLIAECQVIFGHNTYDYSKTKFTRMHDPVIVTCHLHGDFRKQAANLLSGSKCPKCAMIERTAQLHGYSQAPGILYVASIITLHETVVKIGWTGRSFQQRYSGRMHDGLSIRSILELSLPIREAQSLESTIKVRFAASQIIPKAVFEGRTECFRKSALLEICEFVDDYNDPMAGIVE